MLRDSRIALRLFARAPWFTAAALISIALSVGATAVVFTAVKAVLLDPLPYSHPETLVQLRSETRGFAPSHADWVFWNDAQEILRRNRTLESVGVYGNGVFDLGGGEAVTPERFMVSGSRPACSPRSAFRPCWGGISCLPRIGPGTRMRSFSAMVCGRAGLTAPQGWLGSPSG